MKQTLIIVNQKSGTRDKKNIGALFERLLDKKLFSFKLVFTQYKSHATELSRQAVQDNLDLVVVVGGDGSVNEVACGLVHSNTALGILPKGSGNGLARGLHIPLNPDKAIAVLNRFQVRKIDVGYANGHLFLNNAGVGFDALVAKNFEDNSHRGFIQYGFTVIRSLLQHHSKFYELQTDRQQVSQKAFLISIANGEQLGYNFKIAPGAMLDDGLLDIGLIHPLPLWRIPFIAARFLKGNLPESHHVQYMKSKKLTISASEPIQWMQTDGDPIAMNESKVQIEVKPKALKVIVP